MDTGSTHNLLAYDVFITLQNKSFTPVNMDMKVAGSTLSNNIVGKAQLNTEFETTTGTVLLSLSYLIAHKLNGYHSIIGAQMLTNPRIIKFHPFPCASKWKLWQCRDPTAFNHETSQF
jgi:hypothetical protein